jgi:TetR/AcrR family transcriptional regulator, transcriptional repressor for nem operon
MPWPADHKNQTRERIVEAAAAAFRAGGVDRVRLEDIMARAGLTHGGFYAHFKSKDELLRAALERASAETVQRLSNPSADQRDVDRFQAAIDAYLSAAHAAHPEMGCPLATLGPEIVRAGGLTRRTLRAAVKHRLDWMRQLLPEEQRGAVPNDEIVGTLACMIGGIVLARSVGAESDAILTACRRFLHRHRGQTAGRASWSGTKPSARQPNRPRRKRSTT